MGCDNKHSEQIIYRASSMLVQNPDSALKEIAQITYPTKLSAELLANYGWIQAYVHNKKGSSMIDDSLIISSAEYYEQNIDKDKLPYIYKLVAKYYISNDNPIKAIDAYDRGLLYSKQLGDSAQIASFYLEMGMLYKNIKNNEDAIYNFRQSVNYKTASIAYYMLALTEDRESKLETVESYFKSAIENALIQECDTLLAAHYLRNYAQVLQGQKKYKEAIEKIKRTYSLSDYYRHLFMNHIIMAEIYLSLGKLDSAKYYLSQAEDARHNRSFGADTHRHIDTENQLALLGGIINYADRGIIDNTNIRRFNDSIFTVINDHEMLLQAKRASQSLLEQQNFQLSMRQQRVIFRFISGGLFGVIIILTLYFYLRNKTRQLAEAEDRIETLSRLISDTSDVADESSRNFFKKILLQQLGIIRLIAKVPTESNQELIRQMARITNNNIPVDSLLDWNSLYQIIDSIYDRFHAKLTLYYGTLLTEKEIQLCCLILAGFTSKEISVVTQQSIPTIYQRKTSIRKKLKMDEAEEIILNLRNKISNSDNI